MDSIAFFLSHFEQSIASFFLFSHLVIILHPTLLKIHGKELSEDIDGSKWNKKVVGEPLVSSMVNWSTESYPSRIWYSQEGPTLLVHTVT